MKTGGQIRNAVNNIKYYAKQIDDLAHAQFLEDIENSKITGIRPEPGSMRFDCLGAIGSATKWILTYCTNIDTNVKGAESQDKELTPVPEEGEIQL